ncbi:hypothetical protein DMC47_17490 [Nostoc sp. 3335mG]|nr:hypothetical protein DMC47_17490 [Nostoc sp. 3335mG]
MIPAVRLGLIVAGVLASAAAVGLSLSAGTRVDPMPRAATAADPEALLRARIASDYGLTGQSARFEKTNYAAADLDRLIRSRIDPHVANGAVSMRGKDLRFTPADGMRRHAGVIILRYPNAATAASRAAPLLGEKRFFNDSKILTPMVASVRGDKLAIFFTESGGDAKLGAALAGAAARFGGAP